MANPPSVWDESITPAPPQTRCFYCAPRADAATVVIHDARGCVGCCETHHRWRLGTSLVSVDPKHECTPREN